MVADHEIPPGFVDDLLSLPTRERQTEFLRHAGLLDAEGLDRLLDAADALLNDDPGKAGRMAETCAGLADSAGAPAGVPRALYIRAGVHDVNGEFDAELRLTRAAHDMYLELGMYVEALRTNIGRMGTLLDLGRYQQALDTGQAVLDALDGKGEIGVSPTPRERDLLAALVHQNRGGCFQQTGRYSEALDDFILAEEHYRSLGMTGRVGEIIDNKGIVFRYLGRGTEALAAHETAASIFERAGLTLSHAVALGNIGETHLELCNYTRSLEAFERSRRLLSTLDAPVYRHVILLDTANTYLALNLYPEALAAYHEANKLLHDSGMTYELARGLWGKGSALTGCSHYEQAEATLSEAADLFAAVGNAPLLSGVLLERASLRAALGDRRAALETSLQALDIVSEADWPVQGVYARLRVADLLLPDTEAAEPYLIAARQLASDLSLPQLRYRLDERLGRVRLLQGRDREARVALETAVEEIERLRGAVAHDALRASFLRDKTAAYEDLLLLHLAGDDTESIRRGFNVAERAKSRALVDLLTGVSAKEPADLEDPVSEEKVRALQADLNATYNRMLASSDQGHELSLRDLQDRAAGLEQEISRLRLQGTAASPRPDPFATREPPEAILDRLPSETVLLAYHMVGEEIIAFLHASGETSVVRNLGPAARVDRLLRKLDVQWERFRAGRDFAERHMGMLDRSARQVLAALYKVLVGPLEPLLADAASRLRRGDAVRELAVVPHGLLHQVPFHALFDGQRYLVERFEFAYSPSATVYALCQEQATYTRNGAAVFGVEDPLIPAAAIEARTVGGHLPNARILTGESATIEALRGQSLEGGILHLACHGLFRSDNPMFSALKLHDGWLPASDAMSLDLAGALVTLSACESGRNEVIGGDEILGLTRAFLGGGAATLVVSLWLVQDETTVELMAEWYERLQRGEGRAASLRAAQLEIKERYPHPFYWAPFVLIGKR